MKKIQAGLAIVALAAFVAPAMAQTSTTTTTVQSSSGMAVTSGTGSLVSPGVTVIPGTAVIAGPNGTWLPSTTVAPVQAHLIPGGVISTANSTTVMGGPANSKTTVTTYWVNVPPNVEADMAFQRWRSLK